MQQLSAEQFNIQEFGHLGIVAATIDKLGIVEKIDRLIPSKPNAQTTIGQRIKAMILNGLGFVDCRLYMFPEFLANKPMSRLFGVDIDPELFNDDALGRCLDACSDYGVTKLFSTVSMEVGVEQNLLGPSIHPDTTTLTLYGEYSKDSEADETDGTQVQADKATDKLEGASAKTDSEQNNPAAAAKGEVTKEGSDTQELKYESEDDPWPEYGYAKNKRHDLKQMVMTLATSGKAGFPVWFEANSGNASDQKILLEVGKKVNSLCAALKNEHQFLVVGDSAMYNACLKEGGGTLWLTRVPESHGIARDMVCKPDSEFVWSDLRGGYKASYCEVTYKGIKQRWAIIFSKYAYEKEILTLEKKIKVDLEKTKTDLWHLGNKEFACEEDARRHIKSFRKKLKLHDVTTTIEAVTQHQMRGRPKAGALLKTTGYRITGQVVENKVKTDSLRRSKGRFVLATNQLDKEALPDEKMLTEYKEQSKTEGGFKFIKDNTFEVAAVFLKKPSRIQALMMIMSLSLMVYGFVQHHMRARLQAEKETIPNQLKKPTDKPSGMLVFRILRPISVVRVRVCDAVQEFVADLTELRIKVIKIFGPEAMKIYGVA